MAFPGGRDETDRPYRIFFYYVMVAVVFAVAFNFLPTTHTFPEIALTKQQLEELRVESQWASEISDRSLQLLASTTPPPKTAKEEEYHALVFTYVQNQ